MTRPHSDRQLRELSAGMDAGKKPSEIPLTPDPAKRARNNEESRAQKHVIRWFELIVARKNGISPLALFSVPNGGFRSVVTASIMKAEGQKRGVFDLFLAVPRNGKHGLFIEMKAQNGVLSKEQIAFQVFVDSQNYLTAVCRSAEEAIQKIETYLS